MLDVSINLAMVTAMLFGIVWPVHPIKVDSLNSPTAKPIPGGWPELCCGVNRFKSRLKKIYTSVRFDAKTHRTLPVAGRPNRCRFVG